jgi:hypothetical protein
MAPSGLAIVRAAPDVEPLSVLGEHPASTIVLRATIAPMATTDFLSFIASPSGGMP